jgi:hypothetical protein
MEKMRLRMMNQILVRMRKAKKPMGAKSQQDLPFQARGKGITKMMAMETNNLVPECLWLVGLREFLVKVVVAA